MSPTTQPARRSTTRTAFLAWAGLFALLVTLLVGACHGSLTPEPEPEPTLRPVPHATQGAQATVAIMVPNTIGSASAWVPSSLSWVRSLGLISPSLATDAAILYGTNDNSIAVTAGGSLGSYAGASFLQGVGTAGEALGAYKFYAVVRTKGTTPGLTFAIVGDDGLSSTVTIDGGAISIVGPVQVTGLDGGPVIASVTNVVQVTGVDGGVVVVGVAGPVSVNQNQPGLDANRWPVGVTDGVHGQAGIAPASTPAGATNPALIVGLSPNSPLPAGTNALGSVTVSSSVLPIGGATAANQLLQLAQEMSTASSTSNIDATTAFTLPAIQSLLGGAGAIGSFDVVPGTVTPWSQGVAPVLGALMGSAPVFQVISGGTVRLRSLKVRNISPTVTLFVALADKNGALINGDYTSGVVKDVAQIAPTAEYTFDYPVPVQFTTAAEIEASTNINTVGAPASNILQILEFFFG